MYFLILIFNALSQTSYDKEIFSGKFEVKENSEVTLRTDIAVFKETAS